MTPSARDEDQDRAAPTVCGDEAVKPVRRNTERVGDHSAADREGESPAAFEPPAEHRPRDHRHLSLAEMANTQKRQKQNGKNVPLGGAFAEYIVNDLRPGPQKEQGGAESDRRDDDHEPGATAIENSSRPGQQKTRRHRPQHVREAQRRAADRKRRDQAVSKDTNPHGLTRNAHHDSERGNDQNNPAVVKGVVFGGDQGGGRGLGIGDLGLG